MGIDSLKNVCEIFPSVDFVFVTCDAEAHKNRSGVTSGFTSDKEPVFSTQRDRANGIFSWIIVDG